MTERYGEEEMRMVNRIRRRFSLCMAAVLFLTAVVFLPPQARAAEPVSLAGAEIRLDGGDRYEYWGSEHKPGVKVFLNGTEVDKSQYTVEYANNRNAGQATVTVRGTGAYTGSAATHFTIDPRRLSLSDLQVDGVTPKEYDGTKAAAPKVSAQVLPGDSVAVSYTRAEYEDPYVGKQKTVTVSGLRFEGTDGKNYALQDAGGVLVSDGGEITPALFRAKKSAEVALGHTLDLDSLVSGTGGGGVTFQFIGEALGCTLSGSTLTAGQTGGQVSLLATAPSRDLNGDGKPEYDGGQEEITLQLVEKQAQPTVDIGVGTKKQEQPAFSLSGAASVTYGQTLTFHTTGGAGSGQVSYRVETRGASGGATIDANGVLTATQAGKVLVYATKAGDDRYQEAKANPVEVTIHQAQLTIRAHNKTASVGDRVPALSSYDYTISGLIGQDTLAKAPALAYGVAPDMSRAGTYPIQISGAVAPAGGNYRPDIAYVSGTLTVSELPLYPITLRAPLNGTLTADLQAAAPGTVVTLTVRPAEGFRLKELTASANGGKVSLGERSQGTYTFSMPDGGVTVSAVFEALAPALPAIPFTDVGEKDWFYEDVAYVYGKGLMNGTGAKSFQPNAPTTRGMIVTILYRLEGSPAGGNWSPFTDVPRDAYYSAPIAWAAWNGVVNGYSPTSFGPEDPITREQMAAILYRYVDYKQGDVSKRGNLTKFVDAGTISGYAREPLSWANGQGLLQGKEGGRLDPGGPATRAEVAAILHRFCETVLP